jgi:transposase
MRGSDERSGELFSYVDLEDRVPAKHPLRVIREIVNEVLISLDAEFAKLYAVDGRPSIAPERLLRASLLQAFYTIRSERQLMEQLDYNLLYRWFVGLGVDDPVWVPTVFTKNRDRLLEAEVAKKFLAALLTHRHVRPLLSDEHFSVDGTQIAAWASMKSFVPKEEAAAATAGDGATEPPAADPGSTPRSAASSEGTGEAMTPCAAAQPPSPQAPPSQAASELEAEREHRNAEVDFHGQKRSNATHVSTTDPEARLYRKGKGKEAKLSYLGHTLMENRNGLIVETELTMVTGYAEREAALTMIESHCPGEKQLTLGADKAYDAAGFVNDLRQINVTPHIAQNTTNRRSAIDARTTRHAGYVVSQQKRKRIEEPFGWGKTIGGLARPMLRGARRLGFKLTLTMAAYDLVRLPKLLAAAPA